MKTTEHTRLSEDDSASIMVEFKRHRYVNKALRQLVGSGAARVSRRWSGAEDAQPPLR
jgi:hypothetical protein